MVECWINAELSAAHIVLRPNRSWTWRANVGLVSTLAVVSGAIGIGFLLQGMWVILPFNLLEVGIVYLCLRYLLKRTRQQEVIRFDDEFVHIERGALAPEQTTRFARHVAKVHIERPHARPQHISIRARDAVQPIGTFLNDDDRQQLARELRRLVRLFATPAHMRPELFASDSASHSATP